VRSFAGGGDVRAVSLRMKSHMPLGRREEGESRAENIIIQNS